MTAPEQPMPKKSRRLWLWLLSAAFVVLVVAAGVIWVLLPQIVLRIVEAEAARHGIELADCSITLNREQVLLEDCRVKGPEQALEGKVALISISLQGLSPSRIDASGAVLEARAMPEFRSLLEQHAESWTSEWPVSLSDSQLSWYQGPGTAPLLKFTALNYESEAAKLNANLESPGLFAGALSLVAGRLSVQVSLSDAPETRLRAVVQQAELKRDGSPADDSASLDLEIENLVLGRLGIPIVFEVPPELARLTANGRVQAMLSAGLNPKPPSGSFSLTLSGVNLPVPKELHGLVYGPTSTLNGKFTLDHSYHKMTLSGLRWRAGALELKGDGLIEQAGLGLQLQAVLKGNLSCRAIAKSAALAHLNVEWAKLAEKFAQKTLDGAVGIGVELSAHTSKLSEGTVRRKIGVGCGLKPVSIDDALELGGEVLKQIPKLPPPEFKLPSLPPPNFKPPRFEIPLPDFRKRRVVPPAPSAGGDPPP